MENMWGIFVGACGGARIIVEMGFLCVGFRLEFWFLG